VCYETSLLGRGPEPRHKRLPLRSDLAKRLARSRPVSHMLLNLSGSRAALRGGG